jgi:hypothetical protein
VLISDQLLNALDVHYHILGGVFPVDFVKDYLRCFVSTLLQLRKFLEQNTIGHFVQGVLVLYHLW